MRIYYLAGVLRQLGEIREKSRRKNGNMIIITIFVFLFRFFVVVI